MPDLTKWSEWLLTKLKDARPVTHNVAGQDYAVRSDGTLGEPVRHLAPQWTKPVFAVQTLTGIADLVKAQMDEFPEKTALHVVDYLTVELVSLMADDYGRRHVYARAKHVEGCSFKFNEFAEAEDFLIAFRRSFLFTEDALKVQQLCSQLESGMQVTLADDGVSQQLEVKTGTSSRAAVQLPAEGIPLIPWRTFREAAPVESKFLLRLRGVKDGLPRLALFEIDQVWKMHSMAAIANWLRQNVSQIAVIA